MNNVKPKKTGNEKGCTDLGGLGAASFDHLAINDSSDKNNLSCSILPQLNCVQMPAKLSVEEALAAECFPPKLTTGLRYLISHCPTVRKTAEMETFGIPYLPSFLQRANPLLRIYCGVEVQSRSLNDGTNRVEYHFFPFVAEGSDND